VNRRVLSEVFLVALTEPLSPRPARGISSRRPRGPGLLVAPRSSPPLVALSAHAQLSNCGVACPNGTALTESHSERQAANLVRNSRLSPENRGGSPLTLAAASCSATDPLGCHEAGDSPGIPLAVRQRPPDSLNDFTRHSVERRAKQTLHTSMKYVHVRLAVFRSRVCTGGNPCREP